MKGELNVALPNRPPDEIISIQRTKIIGENSNKFWTGKWWGAPDYVLWRSWGRVGDEGTQQSDKMTEQKFRSIVAAKRRDGYKEIVLAKAGIDVQVISGNKGVAPEIEQFAMWIHKEAGTSIKTFLNGTVEALSRQQIDTGRSLLKQLYSRYKAVQSYHDKELTEILQEYYGTIPTKLSRSIDNNTVKDMLRQLLSAKGFDEELDRLEQLEAALKTIQYQNQGVTSYALQLGDTTFEMLKPNSSLWNLISYGDGKLPGVLNRQRRACNKISEIYLVKINKSEERWEQNQVGKDNVVKLFHGTPNYRMRDILLSDGLIVPKVPSNGRRFGDGVYFADEPARSIAYTGTRSYKESKRLLFVCDVALGTPYKMDGEDNRLKSAPKGFDSVWGLKAYSGMDEFIVYNIAQQRIRAILVVE